MKIGTVVDGSEKAAVKTGAGFITVETINRIFGSSRPLTMGALLESGALDELTSWCRDHLSDPAASKGVLAGVRFAPLYRSPRKIWGIGLNYRQHAEDLSERVPEDFPASFMKPDSTIIGHGDPIRIPRESKRTTAEAELGVVIKKQCRHVPRERWLEVVAGFVPVLDMTAEDILSLNPRYLTLSKSFDSFFSFGPVMSTPEEIGDPSRLEVSTVINDQVHAGNVVANMTFPPDYLVAFHSRVMTLYPGDIISTGTPGAVKVSHRDTVECRIEGLDPLVNPVEDLKEKVPA